MLFNKKDFLDYEDIRFGEYLFLNSLVFDTYNNSPNKEIYENICSYKGFLIANSLFLFSYFRKNKYQFDNRLLYKSIFTIFLNYNIFLRSFRREKFFEKNNAIISNRFQNLLNSIIDPIYILRKDKILLIMISLIYQPTINIDTAVKEVEIKENISQDEKFEKNQNITSVQPNRSEEKLKQGRFL